MLRALVRIHRKMCGVFIAAHIHPNDLRAQSQRSKAKSAKAKNSNVDPIRCGVCMAAVGTQVHATEKHSMATVHSCIELIRTRVLYAQEHVLPHPHTL